jgi:hypothetical protein
MTELLSGMPTGEILERPKISPVGRNDRIFVVSGLGTAKDFSRWSK